MLISDLLSICAPVGIFLGRLSNFMNQELVGRQTNFFISIKYPNEEFYRHISQIYEALFEGLIPAIVLIILFYSTRLKQWSSRAISIKLLLSRFMIEFIRESEIGLKNEYKVNYFQSNIILGLFFIYKCQLNKSRSNYKNLDQLAFKILLKFLTLIVKVFIILKIMTKNLLKVILLPLLRLLHYLVILFVINFLRNFKPKKVHLLELGPGNGTLTQDIINFFKSHHISIGQITLIEKSIYFQKKLATKFSNKANIYENLSQIDQKNDEILFIYSNEFFDAIGSKQFIYKKETFYEIGH